MDREELLAYAAAYTRRGDDCGRLARMVVESMPPINADAALPQREPLTDEQQRAAFEAWALRSICVSESDLKRSRLTGYNDIQLNAMWVGWKACAAHGIGGET